jgi:hypothetical protein
MNVSAEAIYLYVAFIFVSGLIAMPWMLWHRRKRRQDREQLQHGQPAE